MESERFPGKPLAPIHGTPMSIRCALNAQKTGLNTYICTDSELIIDTANKYNINAIKTPVFNTGTDRVEWAARTINASIIVNLQGDEPLISTEAINHLQKQDNCRKTSGTISTVQAYWTKKSL